MTKYIMTSYTRLFAAFLALIIVCLGIKTTSAATSPATPTWDNPTSVSISSQGVSAPAGQPHLSFEDNLDCLRASYRLNGTGNDQIGCYVQTAFGILDVGNDLIGFAGNEDSVVPLIPYSPHEVLLPWPATASMLSVIPAATEGAYLSLYRYILNATVDVHNLSGDVTAKKVTKPSDLPLLDNNGRKLIVNFNSLAFSDGGAWLVAESVSGLFYRINLTTLSAQPFAPSYANLGAGYTQSQVAVSADGNFVAIANSAAKSLKVYNLSSCQSSSSQSNICPSYDYWGEIATKVPDWQHPVRVRFLNNSLLSFTNVLSSGETTYQLSPSANGLKHMSYLALGDSYTSGEGAFAYRAGTDTENNTCHSSANSYPSLLIQHLFSRTSGNSVACSGAVINDIAQSPTYAGQAKDGVMYNKISASGLQIYLNNYTAGYLPQAAFAAHYQPSALTVSVGGNDIGFGNILKMCLAPHLNRHLTDSNGCYSTYEDRLELSQTIDAQIPRLTQLYKRLQAATPNSTIYVVGYPLLAVDNGNCAVNVRLSTVEIALSIEIIKHLNLAVAKAAGNAKVNYVNIENALAGHRLCEVKSNLVAVNGVTAGKDAGLSTSIVGRPVNIKFLGRESFHPNSYGYQLIEQAILGQTHNLQLKPAAAAPLPLPSPSPSPQTTNSKLLQAPKTSRAITKKIPSKITTKKSLKRGDALKIHIKGTEHGVAANKPHKVTLRSDHKVIAIGVINSDDSGDINADLTIPPSTPPDTYEIGVSGDNQLGHPVTMIDVITVIHSEADYDGDGILDIDDSCPTIPLTTPEDTDRDGIDDACDGFIDSPPDVVADGTNNVNVDIPSTPSLTSNPSTNLPADKQPMASVLASVNTAAVLPRHLEVANTGAVTNVGSRLQLETATPQPSTKLAVSAMPKIAVAPSKLTPTVLAADSIKQVKSWQRLPSFPLLWFVAIYASSVLIYWLSSFWRRERDSNPRYP